MTWGLQAGALLVPANLVGQTKRPFCHPQALVQGGVGETRPALTLTMARCTGSFRKWYRLRCSFSGLPRSRSDFPSRRCTSIGEIGGVVHLPLSRPSSGLLEMHRLSEARRRWIVKDQPRLQIYTFIHLSVRLSRGRPGFFWDFLGYVCHCLRARPVSISARFPTLSSSAEAGNLVAMRVKTHTILSTASGRGSPY